VDATWPGRRVEFALDRNFIRVQSQNNFARVNPPLAPPQNRC
jgi:hypothetical protein